MNIYLKIIIKAFKAKKRQNKIMFEVLSYINHYFKGSQKPICIHQYSKVMFMLKVCENSGYFK